MLQDGFQSLLSRAIKAPNTVGLAIGFPAGKSPSNEERTALSEHIRAVRQALDTVVTEDEVKDAISLLTSGLKLSGQVSGSGIGRAYALVLSDVPSAILKQAIKNLLTGKAEGMDRTFMPSAPDLLGYCEKLHRDCLALCSSTERLLSLPEAEPEEPISEEQRQAMRQKIAQLAKPRTMEAD